MKKVEHSPEAVAMMKKNLALMVDPPEVERAKKLDELLAQHFPDVSSDDMNVTLSVVLCERVVSECMRLIDDPDIPAPEILPATIVQCFAEMRDWHMRYSLLRAAQEGMPGLMASTSPEMTQALVERMNKGGNLS